jgi:hypothetical protein
MPRRSWPHGATASRTSWRLPPERPVTDQRGRLLMAALGFAWLPRPSYDRALRALRFWLDSWAGIGHVAVGMPRQGYDLQLTQYDERLARDLLHDRDGALPHQCDGYRVGAHALARDAAGERGRR